MKHSLLLITAMLLCAAAVCALPAFASEEKPALFYNVPLPVWGTATPQGEHTIFVENPDAQLFPEILLHTSSEIRMVDAVTGLPLNRSVRSGETVYAWIAPAVLTTLPPQGSAEMLAANLPADAAAPQYVQIASVSAAAPAAEAETDAVIPQVTLTTTAGESLTVTALTQLTPWMTRQRVGLDDLVPGTRMLVWRAENGSVTKAVLFPYTYQAWVGWNAQNAVSVNGEALFVPARPSAEGTLLPIRAVTEAAGYTVNWVSGQGVVVHSDAGEEVLTVCPGKEFALTANGKQSLLTPVVYDAGVTYMAPADLGTLLNFFCFYS